MKYSELLKALAKSEGITEGQAEAVIENIIYLNDVEYTESTAEFIENLTFGLIYRDDNDFIDDMVTRYKVGGFD